MRIVESPLRNFLRSNAGFAVAVFVSLTPPTQSHACVCPARPPVAEAIQKSALVALGTVVAVTDRSSDEACKQAVQGVPVPPDEQIGVCGLAITLHLDALWKGPRKPDVIFVTGTGGGDCGFEFRTGSRYVIFGRKLASGKLYTDRCSYSQEASEAGTMMKALGAPKWKRSA